MNFRFLVDHVTGEPYLAVARRGVDLLNDPFLNKGAAFTREEREAFGLRGLLPDHVATLDEQLLRVRTQYEQKAGDLERNIYLNGLMDRNETLFYRYLLEHLEEVMPIVYTPTVAKACRYWSRIYRRAHGLYITPRDRGRIAELLLARPVLEPPVIVVTDNERILGIGDQGAGGMGIPIGKLALYTAAAGIHPARCIPISLDVGTNNAELLADPLYLGYREPRLRGPEYDELVDEFVAAVREVFPDALVQWEDFANRTSFDILHRYRDVVASFNDDIQGTAAMVVAGLLVATRELGRPLGDQVVVIAGAGSAGVGIREQLVAAMVDDGLDPGEAARRIFVLDSRGLLTDDAPDLSDIKRRAAVPAAVVEGWDCRSRPPDLVDVIRNTKATVLIGVSGRGGLFTEEVVRELASRADRPVIMPLSNPTSHAEVTPANALRWSDGRAIVATGSPFPPVEYDGRVHRIGQANNVFVFPGVGLGVLTVRARRVSDGMFLAAAKALADQVPAERVAEGQLFPDVAEVRSVSEAVARAVAAQAVAEGLADPVDDLTEAIAAERWYPEYLPYRPAAI
ncbi:MAG TPA: NAD-dependent malic enzyme [Actinobacteria bacterium]|nr:NAD-dependent malic enzyme [Actinomycetota bacterium]